MHERPSEASVICKSLLLWSPGRRSGNNLSTARSSCCAPCPAQDLEGEKGSTLPPLCTIPMKLALAVLILGATVALQGCGPDSKEALEATVTTCAAFGKNLLLLQLPSCIVGIGLFLDENQSICCTGIVTSVFAVVVTSIISKP